MMRTATLFNRTHRASTKSMTVTQAPTVHNIDGQYVTSMKYNVLMHESKHGSFDMEARVPHGKISSFTNLLRIIAKLPPECAAMVTLAHADMIPPTAAAVEQLKVSHKPNHELNAYLRVQLDELYAERLDTAERAASTPALLTKFY